MVSCREVAEHADHVDHAQNANDFAASHWFWSHCEWDPISRRPIAVVALVFAFLIVQRPHQLNIHYE